MRCTRGAELRRDDHLPMHRQCTERADLAGAGIHQRAHDDLARRQRLERLIEFPEEGLPFASRDTAAHIRAPGADAQPILPR